MPRYVNPHVVLVGAGPMACAYAEVLAALGCAATAVCRGAASAAAFKARTGFEAVPGGLARFIAEHTGGLPQAAIVAVGVEELAPATILLLRAGVRRILVEKPAGLDATEIGQVALEATALGAEVFVAYNRRFYASTIRASEMIAEDGGVTSLAFDFTERSDRVAELPYPRRVKESWLLANASHVIDLAFFLAGAPAVLHAQVGGGLDWHPSAAQFAGCGHTALGGSFSYHADWEAPGRWSVEVRTPARRLLMAPLEELRSQRFGSFDLVAEALDDAYDRRFKPGLLRQVEGFLFGAGAEWLHTIQAQALWAATVYDRIGRGTGGAAEALPGLAGGDPRGRYRRITLGAAMRASAGSGRGAVAAPPRAEAADGPKQDAAPVVPPARPVRARASTGARPDGGPAAPATRPPAEVVALDVSRRAARDRASVGDGEDGDKDARGRAPTRGRATAIAAEPRADLAALEAGGPVDDRIRALARQILGEERRGDPRGVVADLALQLRRLRPGPDGLPRAWLRCWRADLIAAHGSGDWTRVVALHRRLARLRADTRKTRRLTILALDRLDDPGGELADLLVHHIGGDRAHPTWLHWRRTWSNRIRAHLNGGAWGEAWRLGARLLAVEPAEPSIVKHMVRIAEERPEFRDELTRLIAALRASGGPDDRTAAHWRGRWARAAKAAMLAGDWEAAEAFAAWRLALQPDDLPAHLDRVAACAARQDLKTLRTALAALRPHMVATETIWSVRLRRSAEHLLEQGAVRAAAEILVACMAETREQASAIDRLLGLAERRGATAAVLAVAERCAEDAPGLRAFIEGMLALGSGSFAEGVGRLEAALAEGLRGAAAALARTEIEATRFRRVRPADPVVDGDIVVVVEPGASPDPIRPLLGRGARVHVCSGSDEADARLTEFAAALPPEALTTIPYRLFDISEFSAALEAFSEAYVARALAALGEAAGLPAWIDDYKGCFSVWLYQYAWGDLRHLHNIFRAIDIAGASRLYLLYNGGHIFDALLAAFSEGEGPVAEVQVACGAPGRGARRVFQERWSGAPAGRAAAPQPPPEPADPDRAAEALRRLVGGSDLAAALPDPPSTPYALVTSAAHRADITGGLVDVLERLLDRLPTTLLELGRPDQAEVVADGLAGALGPRWGELRTACIGPHLLPKEDCTHALAQALAGRILDEPEMRSHVYRGVRLASLLDRACRRFMIHVLYGLALIGWLEAWFARTPPALVLLPAGYRFETWAAAVAARRHGVPGLALQVLLVGRDRRLRPPTAERLLVFDRYARDVYVDYAGYPADRVDVIGSVRLDRLLGQARRLDRDEVRAALGLAPGTRLVVLASQPFALEQSLELVRITAEAVADLCDVHLVVKLHPRESEARIAPMLTEVERHGLGGRATVTRDEDTYRLLIASDLVVTMMSNVGLEAWILDRRVVSVDVGVDITSFSLADLGLTEPVSGHEAAVARVRALLLDPAAIAAEDARRRVFHTANPELCDGRSVERLMTIVDGLLAPSAAANIQPGGIAPDADRYARRWA